MITLSKSFDEIKYGKQYVYTCSVRILPDFLVSCLKGRIKRMNKKNRSTQTLVGNCRIKMVMSSVQFSVFVLLTIPQLVDSIGMPLNFSIREIV